MSRIILVTMLLLPFLYSNGKKARERSSSETRSIEGGRFTLEYQAFASHDKSGTDRDTVSHKGDYIIFSGGKAYLNFDEQKDTLDYAFVGAKSVSFGDTPFLIKSMGNDRYTLYQHEEETNGDYNNVTYFLKKDTEISLAP